MLKIFVSFLWFLVFTKLLIFWVWLWQLKEYRLARIKDHFRAQKIKKIIFSLHGIRYPKLTKKTGVILIFGTLIEFFILFYSFSLSDYFFYLILFILIVGAPLFFSFLILFFQIPSAFLLRRTFKKARTKIKSRQDLLVIAVAGSYGKTSTKEFLATILEERFKVLKTPGHQNTDYGIARCVLNQLNAEHRIFIAETGAYGLGEITKPCKIIQPKIGILTGVNEQHLSLFGSIENIVNAKFELIESLPEKGIAILNWDNKFIKSKIKSQTLKTKTKNLKFCSTQEETDIWAKDIVVEKEKISFKVFSKNGDSANFNLNLLGKQNIENVLLAICCAQELGLSLESISKACLKIKQDQAGTKILKKNDLTILDGSYSANPYGVIADLDYLKIYPQKKIIVMPSLIELGKASKQIHEKIGEKIGAICDLALITTKDNFREIQKGAISVGMKPEGILLLEDTPEIIKKINHFCAINQNKCILLFGGRVPKELIEKFNR
jgi:UDP-N-acetylmuramoyl-tripeptide--D-alanyl-D-alanine ligase